MCTVGERARGERGLTAREDGGPRGAWCRLVKTTVPVGVPRADVTVRGEADGVIKPDGGIGPGCEIGDARCGRDSQAHESAGAGSANTLSPPYDAVTEWSPIASVPIETLAWPPDKVPTPITVAPSETSPSPTASRPSRTRLR